MRPDLILVNDDGMVMPPKIVTNRLMAPGLDAFIRRHAAAHQDQEEYGDDLWSSAYKRQKVNFHLRDSAIPVPKVVQHSRTLEEKQSKRMNVMQCTRVRQLVSAIPSSDSWIWPNNPASMLRRPLLLLWFKPHSRRDTVMLESWLDVALSSGLHVS
ncbi:uncharacterized protein LOC125179326 [Hyalella azteca]|uniref:Uncharacterized protein LOC125179326 n=1 Tax=Hyalella azteca TaxID=294128 RepID=A0A979FUM2_HYAAZ|nr:uncharacterized protein LOC125179326 [Hyalella azteca]